MMRLSQQVDNMQNIKYYYVGDLVNLVTDLGGTLKVSEKNLEGVHHSSKKRKWTKNKSNITLVTLVIL